MSRNTKLSRRTPVVKAGLRDSARLSTRHHAISDGSEPAPGHRDFTPRLLRSGARSATSWAVDCVIREVLVTRSPYTTRVRRGERDLEPAIHANIGQLSRSRVACGRVAGGMG